ncbi:Beta-ketoacyl synthase (fragment) [Frankia canadensis]|uniref:Beta-ketoacyl synthase n=1 Tax=Frankia canadensis TaxID=1836972 RepID=A0A2I2KYG6_9ACTN
MRGIVDWIVERTGPDTPPGEPASRPAEFAADAPGENRRYPSAPGGPAGPGGSRPGGTRPGHDVPGHDVPGHDVPGQPGSPRGDQDRSGRGRDRHGAAGHEPGGSAAAARTGRGEPALVGAAQAAAAAPPGWTAAAATTATGAASAPPVTGGADEDVEAIPLQRFVVEPQAVAAPADVAPADLTGCRFLLVEGGLGVGLALATRLEQAGAEVRILAADDPGLVDQIRAGAGADGLAWIASADPDANERAVLPGAFPALRAAALGGSRRVLAVTGNGGRFGRSTVRGGDAGRSAPGAGLAGLVRTIAREVPGLALRVVDVEVKEEPRQIANSLFTELLGPGGPVVVGYREGARATPRVTPAPLGQAADVPAGLDASSVVLLTGGARGITAAVALELARRTGCAVELVGRTAPPTAPEDPATAGAPDAPALRRALIETGIRRPAEIEARLARLLAEREVRTNLAALEGLAASVRYHAVDVRDAAAVAAVVADVYDRHGRLDGLVHGAGILADRLLRDKTAESFDRVFRTKADGARALLAAVRDDIGFVALFGSVAGVFGNRGQADYAAANDALDTLAIAAAERFSGRVVSVDWGPWGAAPSAAGAGMVSPELAREYARRGIGLIDPAEGVDALLRELAGPADGPPQVVYMCAGAGAFDA